MSSPAAPPAGGLLRTSECRHRYVLRREWIGSGWNSELDHAEPIDRR